MSKSQTAAVPYMSIYCIYMMWAAKYFIIIIIIKLSFTARLNKQSCTKARYRKMSNHNTV